MADATEQAGQWVEQGVAFSQGGDSTQAMRCWEEAAALAPGWGVPHFLLGSELAAQQAYAAAEAAFAQALLLDPQFLLARYQLGLLQFSSGRPALALLTWQPLQQLPPESAWPRWVAGFAALAQDRLPEAHACFLQGLDAGCGNVAVEADIHRVLQRLEAAMAAAADTAGADATGHVLLSAYRAPPGVH